MILHAASNSISLSIPLSAAQSLEEFRNWVDSDEFPGDGKYMYYRNEVFLDMAAEWASSHSAVKSEICRVVGNFVTVHRLGKVHNDGMWFTHEAADVSNEPDGMFVSREAFESGRIELIKSANSDDGIEYRGSPDWTLEVVSDRSVDKDTAWLPQAYHAANVPEFWLVDARGETIDFRVFV